MSCTKHQGGGVGVNHMRSLGDTHLILWLKIVFHLYMSLLYTYIYYIIFAELFNWVWYMSLAWMLDMRTCFHFTLGALAFFVLVSFLCSCVLIRSRVCKCLIKFFLFWIWVGGLWEYSIPKGGTSDALVTRKHVYISFITFWKCYKFTYCSGSSYLH